MNWKSVRRFGHCGGVPVVASTMLLLLVLALGVLAAVALPQLREGKTVFSQAGLDQMDDARRRAAAMARRGNDSAGGEVADAPVSFGPDLTAPKSRLRAPIGWTETTSGPRHAR